MSKITLRVDTLAVESFEPAPGPGDVPGAWTDLDCGTHGQLTANWAYTCGADITCQYYNCDS
ncbi:MAG TPA: hypothetical protein VLK84_20315 [Longimicrobium sp.]|nr:hypothetical protein [Longimicrobium sp.]